MSEPDAVRSEVRRDQEGGAVDEQASAVYDPMIPMGWIGGKPADRELTYQPGAAVPADWTDVVVTHRLACCIEVTAQRRGFTVYDFSAWRPGVPERSRGIPHTREPLPGL